MKHLFSSLAVAAACALVAAAPAHAADTNLGTLSNGAIQNIGGFGTTDTWTFDLGAGYTWDVSIVVEATTFNLGMLGLIGYDITGAALGVFPLTSTTTTVNGQTTEKWSLSLDDTSAGTYVLTVAGQTGAGGLGAYTGSISAFTAAPVPEPESYAMMLAGLGAIGFMARRRRSTAA